MWCVQCCKDIPYETKQPAKAKWNLKSKKGGNVVVSTWSPWRHQHYMVVIFDTEKIIHQISKGVFSIRISVFHCHQWQHSSISHSINWAKTSKKEVITQKHHDKRIEPGRRIGPDFLYIPHNGRLFGIYLHKSCTSQNSRCLLLHMSSLSLLRWKFYTKLLKYDNMSSIDHHLHYHIIPRVYWPWQAPMKTVILDLGTFVFCKWVKLSIWTGVPIRP